MVGFQRVIEEELRLSGSNLLSFFISWLGSCLIHKETASRTVKQLAEIQTQFGLSPESSLFMNKHAAWVSPTFFTRISLKVFEIFNQSDFLPQWQRSKRVIWMECFLVCSHEYASTFKRPSLCRNNLLSCLSVSLSRDLFPPQSGCLITQLRRDLRLTTSDDISRLPAFPSSLYKH